MKFIVDTTAHDVKHARRMVNSFQGNDGYFSSIAVRHHAGIITGKRNQEIMTSARERADHWWDRLALLEDLTTHRKVFDFKTGKYTGEYVTKDGLAINGIAFNACLDDALARIYARIDVRRKNADVAARWNELPYALSSVVRRMSLQKRRVGPGERYRSGLAIVNEKGPELVEGKVISQHGHYQVVEMLPKGTNVIPHDHTLDAFRYWSAAGRDLMKRPVDPGRAIMEKTLADIIDEAIVAKLERDAWKYKIGWRISNIFEYIASGLRTIWPKH